MKIRALAAIGAAAALLLTGCGGGSSGSSAAPTSAAPVPKTLTVLAAASLTETFTALGKQFETDNPGVTVKFNFAGSSDLAQQIVNGAPADVFAAASDATMKTVTDANLTAAKPAVFATNVLEIATPPGNPKAIASFADLAKPGVKVVVCAPQVPCGAATALLLTGCGGGSSGSSAAPASAAPAAAPKTLTVQAAASLTETFTALGKQFETDNPGVTVKFNFAGSSDLAQQIVNGAPADVFAAASDATMKTVTDAKLTAAPPVIFAKNILEIATPPGNPKGIATFADLAKPGVKVVVCAPQVPCGAATQKVEQSTGTKLTPVSEEADVKSVLSKVESGDADAGLVYLTDVKSAGDKVTGVPFPEANTAPTNYPIAALKNAPQPDLANQFVTLVTGEQGQKTMEQAGFAAP